LGVHANHVRDGVESLLTFEQNQEILYSVHCALTTLCVHTILGHLFLPWLERAMLHIDTPR